MKGRIYGIKLESTQFASRRHDEQGVRVLVEQLRYAGIIRNREGENAFVLRPPEHVMPHGSQGWAEASVARMRSFGLDPKIVWRSRGSSDDWAEVEEQPVG